MSAFVCVACLLLGFINPVYGLQDASCNFADSQCEWHTDDNTTPRWIRNDEVFWNFGHSNFGVSGYHMELHMKNHSVNATGRLLSPNITGSVNQTCQMRMVYAVEDHTACQLSVWLTTGTNLTSLLMTLDDTYNFDKSPYISVPCTADTYQIMIEGKKLSESPCGNPYNKIGIASIEYYVKRTTGEGSMTGGGDDNKVTQPSQAGQRNDMQGGSDVGLSRGAVAAIAIVVNNAAVVVLVAAYCLVKKRAKKQEAPDHRIPRASASSRTPNNISSIRESPGLSHPQDDNVPSVDSTRNNEYLTPVSEASDATNHNTQHTQQEMPAYQNNPYERLDRNHSENRPYEALAVNRRE